MSQWLQQRRFPSSITFWADFPSFHQAGLLQGLVEVGVKNVSLFTEGLIPATRVNQGWETPNYKGISFHPDYSLEDAQHHLSRFDKPEDVHILFGLGNRLLSSNLREHLPTKALIGVMSEAARKDDGLRSKLRFLKYLLKGKKESSRFNFALGMGELGSDWFKHIQFPDDKVHTFGYFPEIPVASLRSEADRNGQLNILFVGSFISQKNFDVVVELSQKAREHHFTFVGSGPLEAASQRLISSDSSIKNTTFAGNIPNSSLGQYFQNSDILLLPSRFDGWGVVVNEALANGTRVITSDQCGAASLIQSESQGIVLSEVSAKNLSNAIERLASTRHSRSDLQEWASNTISPESGARYLLRILEHVYNGKTDIKPTPPWVK